MSAAATAACMLLTSFSAAQCINTLLPHPFQQSKCSGSSTRSVSRRQGAVQRLLVVKVLSSQDAAEKEGADNVKAGEEGLAKSSAVVEGAAPRGLPRKGAGSGFGTVPLRPKGSFTSKKPKGKGSKPAESEKRDDDDDGDSRVKEQKESGVIRRAPPRKPLVEAPVNQSSQQVETVAVFLLIALFGLIIVEGLALSISGFLPEEWDEFLLKSVYPSYTPTVGLFFASAIIYGLFKYLGVQTKK